MMSYIAPALTPTSGNPTFRVYLIDPVTFGILDVVTYYTNISDPAYQTTGPVWEELYSIKDTYGALLGVTDPAAELTPAFWHNVTELFETSDAVFQEYIGRKTRDYNPSTCTGDCKTAELCQLRAAQSQYNCITVSPGINLKKRVETTDAAADLAGDECEGSKAIPILSSMYVEDTGMDVLRQALVNVAGESFLNTTISSNYTVGS